jgi:hypothetical protein
LDKDTVSNVLRSLKTAESTVTPEKVNEWKEMAVAMGIAVNEISSSINIQSNEFIKTPVGFLVVALLCWKIVGADLFGKMMAIPLYMFVISIILWSYRRLHIGRKIKKKDSDGNIVTEIVFYPWSPKIYGTDPSAKAISAAAHAIAFFVVTIVIFMVLMN